MTICIIYVLTFLMHGSFPEFKKNVAETMYVGIENYIKVSLNNCNPEDVNIRILPLNLYRRDDSTFAFNPQVITDELKIKLYYKKVLCEIKTVKVKRIPEPALLLEGEINGNVRMSDLNKTENLVLQYPAEFPEEYQTKIYTFTIFIRDPNGRNLYSGNVQTEKIPEDVLKIIRILRKDSSISVSNVVTYSQINGHNRINTIKEIMITD